MPRRRAQRRATQNSPSSLASVQPMAPAYQPRSRPSKAGINGTAAAWGSPPTAGVGMQQRGEFDGAQRMGELGADRGGEVLDVRDADDRGLVGRGDPDGVGSQGAGDPADDDLLLLAVLGGAHELLAEVVVDGGVGGAAGGAGQRDGLGAGPSRRTSSSGEAATKAASPRPAQKT